MVLEVGSIVEGKVSGITNFGAFIDLEGGSSGLVHISEVSRSYVKDINEHLKVGDVVKVKVMSIDDRGKIGLSIKKALEEVSGRKYVFSGRPAEIKFDSQKSSESMSFEDMMAHFKQESNDKMQDVKKAAETRRTGYKKPSGTF
ncbi:MAG: S1 RNA-binding domain-containing protein [Bacillota bacterium]|nr:S1 RNA-binding domain-containing protein [Bacillota bacterium]